MTDTIDINIALENLRMPNQHDNPAHLLPVVELINNGCAQYFIPT